MLEGTEYPGDGDPLDAIDLDDEPAKIGQVKQVKVLGALGLIDCDEIDWKIITVGADNKLAPVLNGTLLLSLLCVRVFDVPIVIS